MASSHPRPEPTFSRFTTTSPRKAHPNALGFVEFLERQCYRLADYPFERIPVQGQDLVNDTGANSAQLLGFQARQLAGENVGLQMVSERCKDGGWLQAILDQNSGRCAEGQTVDLKFMLGL